LLRGRADLRHAHRFQVSPDDRHRLEAVVRDRNAPQKHAWRAQSVPCTADGLGTNAIMRAIGKSKNRAWRWQERLAPSAPSELCAEEGVDGLLRDKTRPARIPPLDQEVVDRVLALTFETPWREATNWTGGMMAEAAGISVSSVQRIWRKRGLQPHRVRQFKHSNVPPFADKLREVVGLYMDPPAHALVFSVDENSQIQALNRTQPGLPLKKGRAGTMTHD
jgi:hypothetical protein